MAGFGGGDEFFCLCFWRGRGFLGVEGADLEFGFEFLEDGFVVVFPELLGGVFAGDSG